MKLRLLFLVAFLFIGGCATTSTQTFQQKAASVCAVVQPTLASVQTEASLLNPPLDTTDAESLVKARGVVDKFCSTTATATSATTQGMLNSVMPVVLHVVANSSLDDKTRSALMLSIVGVQTAANVILSQQSTTPATTTTTQAQ